MMPLSQAEASFFVLLACRLIREGPEEGTDWMKRIFVLAGVWALLTMLVGCSGGSGNTEIGLTADKLVGTWRATRMTIPGGATTACPGSIVVSPSVTVACGATDDLTLQADGTVATLENGVLTPGGTWSLTGSTLRTITHPTVDGVALPDTITVDFTAALSGNTLTLTVQSTLPVASEAVGFVTVMVKQ
jgi:hypothetical protein